MPSIKRLWTLVCSFVRNLLRRERVERELSEEIDSFAELLTEEKVAQGMPPNEARRAARHDLGRAESVKEQVRDVRVGAWLDVLRQDVRFAVRTLGRRPGFAAVTVLTLAVGIGATTAIFSLIDSVLLKPLPFKEPDRLTLVWEVRPRFNLPRVGVSPANYVDWQKQAQSFENLAAYVSNFVNLTGTGRPERLAAARVTPNLFPTLGVEPLLGRGFVAPEGSPGQTAVAILSYGFWQRRFGGDRGLVGKTILLDGEPHRVVGVMARRFQFPAEDIQVWTPVDYREQRLQSRDGFFLVVVGRLKPDVSLEQVNTELATVAGALAQTYPANIDSSAFAVPLQQDLARNARTSFLLLLTAAVMVLLIACANVAGLLVTRGEERDREFAIRTSLGGSRVQLLRQLLVEGLLLSAAGAIVGVILAAQTFGVLETLVPESLRGAVAPALDVRLLTVAFVATLLTGLVFGLVPLRYAMRMDLRTPLNTRTGIGITNRRRAQAVLVAGEVALAVVVLFSTGLMVRTVINLQAVDPGFRMDNVLTANLWISPADYPTPERQNEFYREVLERVSHLPGVVSAGFTTFLPYTTLIGAAPVSIEGRPNSSDGSDIVIMRYVTSDFLKTIAVPLVHGRGFSDRDTGKQPAVALVSERVAALFDGNPVGRKIAFGPMSLTVVGVVGDIKGEGLETPNTRGTVYMPAAQLGQIGFFTPRDLAIRTISNPTAIAAAMQQEIWAVNPNQTIANIRTLESVVEGQISDRKVQTGLFTAFAGLALFMTALGVYGLLSFVVTSRIRELGVRMAMGAQRRDLVSLIAGDSAVWVICGLGGGLALAALVSRSMRTIIYGVEPLDWLSLLASTCVLGAVACIAALRPVWRATRVEPMAVLRVD